jgi:glycosyltransferase involved in cell wall biosynthesis
MEYMALGKPMVQFDLKEGRFSAQDASLYSNANDPVDFAEKVLEHIDKAERRARMSAHGRKRVEEALAWHHEQPKLLNAYARLAELRGRRKFFVHPPAASPRAPRQEQL